MFGVFLGLQAETLQKSRVSQITYLLSRYSQSTNNPELVSGKQNYHGFQIRICCINSNLKSFIGCCCIDFKINNKTDEVQERTTLIYTLKKPNKQVIHPNIYKSFI